MSGVPTFMELGVPDAEKARDFYSAVFPAWNWGPKPNGFRVHTDTVTAGIHGGDDTRELVVYLSVDNIDEAVKRIRDAGGEADAIMDGGPQYGRFAECKDNQGVSFGVHEPPAS
ncbi:VOC family protein [Catelliglobosispora koreensis]|uniref:VOC family protein n=1 Tax=Catelliglobosispora koreensis TaxID=129052 RepID=UPI00037581CA|nr:hypothetical protein [Catelliglobosispora koreensis]